MPCASPYKLDSFQLVDNKGSTMQLSCNTKAATRAAFTECEPDGTNIEPFCWGFKINSRSGVNPGADYSG